MDKPSRCSDETSHHRNCAKSEAQILIVTRTKWMGMESGFKHVPLAPPTSFGQSDITLEKMGRIRLINVRKCTAIHDHYLPDVNLGGTRNLYRP